MKFYHNLYTFLLCYFGFGKSEKLFTVITLSRHGDRSISETYPTDAYQNQTYWPEGYGELLSEGKLRSYILGKWLRKRYEKLLSNNYKRNEIQVFSSDKDRCIMSAQCTLAGMFVPYNISPTFPEIFQLWEPVPIHTRPLEEDPYLAIEAPCPRWDVEYANLNKESSSYIREKYSNLLKYISTKTGWEEVDLDCIRTLYKVLYVYKEYNRSYIPSWVDSLSKSELETLRELAGLSFALETFTTQLKRLSAGPFIKKFLQYIGELAGKKDHLKFLMLYGHDTTLTAVLNTMGCYDNSPPEYSATVIWELWQKDDGNIFVRMFYLRTTETMTVEPLKVRGCDSDCDFITLQELLKPYTISNDIWKKECNISS